MSSPYASRFWKKNWDPNVKDLDPKEFDTTYPEMIAETFKEYANKMAIEYLGVELTFKEIDEYSNQFANMLIDHGFKKGDMVGINLPNTPLYYRFSGNIESGMCCIRCFSTTFCGSDTVSNQ